MFMFFFDNRLSDPFNLSEKEMMGVRERLNMETTAQGLRNVEVADLTGWSTSKVSKITSGKQKLTDDDIRIWSRALGYTPEAFLTEDYDKRSFKLMDHVRNVTDCLSAYLGTDQDDPEHSAIMNLELPLSIIATLGLRATDYAVRTRADKTVKDPVMGNSHTEHSYIRIWNRDTSVKNQMTPELYFCVSPNEDVFAIILYLNRNGTDGVLQNLREDYKNILKKEEEGRECFRIFSENAKDWLPRNVRDGEISSYCCATDILPDQAQMTDILTILFREYFEVVWEAKGIDLTPEYFRDASESEFSPVELYNIISGSASFEPNVVRKVLQTNRYQCEIDPEHKTFTTDSDEQYMEVAPIIPLVYAPHYGKSAMGEANAVCLCPTCHAKLLYGKHEDREDMLMMLFRKHKDTMKKAGIEITTSDLLRFNGL